MFLTSTDLINAKLTSDGRLTDGQIVKKLIEQDIASPEKLNMAVGERYYVGEQDVLAKNFQRSVILETDEDTGEEKTTSFSNPNRSNHHNVNAFHRILTDQKASYLLSREPTISVRGAEASLPQKAYETMLTEFADERFNEVMMDWVVGASNKGFEAIHFYYDPEGALHYCIVPAAEIIPVYDTEHQEQLVELIRYFTLKTVQGDRTVNRRKVEWWTKEDVTYYIETDSQEFVLDGQCFCNPAPHWWEVITLDGMEKRREKHNWGRVPFVILENNSKRTSDLQPVKGLIDAYDLISSEGTNNLLDLVDLYWAIQGYGGETAQAIVKKLQMNRAVHVEGGDGGRIEAKQISLPVEGRLEWLKMLRRDIFHFGQGIDTDADRFGNAPSGVSLKFQYTQLDLKANALAVKLKRALKEFFWFVTNDYNRRHGANYDSASLEIIINKSMIANDLETVQMITASQGIVSDKTLLAKHPFVDDVNAELAEKEAQEKNAISQFASYQGLGPGDDDGQEA